MDKNLLEKLLNNHKIIQIATSEANIPWICNVYFYYDKGNIYFLSDKKAKHSLQILVNSQIAFALAEYNPEDYDNRKGVQWIGKCGVVSNDELLKWYCTKFDRDYHELAGYMQENTDLALRRIIPSYIKYWDDENLWEEGVKEFTF